MNMTREIRAELRDLKRARTKLNRDLAALRRRHDRELRSALRGCNRHAKMIDRRLDILTGRLT